MFPSGNIGESIARATPRKGSRLFGGLVLSLGLHALALAWILPVILSASPRAAPPADSVPIMIMPEPSDRKPSDREPSEQPLPLSPPPTPPAVVEPLPSPRMQPAAEPVPLRHSDARPPPPAESTAKSGTPDIPPPPNPATVSLQDDMATAAPPSPTGSSTEADDETREDVLRRYGLEIWNRVLRHKPSHIRLRGTVTLTFTVAVNGDLSSATVSRSSGSDILDQAALDALRQAAPFPPPPTGGQPSPFVLPFSFH